MAENKLSVLLVDDDDVACESVVRSFKKHNLDLNIVMAHDGLEALEIIRSQHPNKQIAHPYITLLDLNMPLMNGFEFLEELRADAEHSSNVVFILTTSDDNSDIVKAYENYVAGYMVKSAIGPQFSQLHHLLTTYEQSISFRS